MSRLISFIIVMAVLICRGTAQFPDMTFNSFCPLTSLETQPAVYSDRSPVSKPDISSFLTCAMECFTTSSDNCLAFTFKKESCWWHKSLAPNISTFVQTPENSSSTFYKEIAQAVVQNFFFVICWGAFGQRNIVCPLNFFLNFEFVRRCLYSLSYDMLCDEKEIAQAVVQNFFFVICWGAFGQRNDSCPPLSCLYSLSYVMLCDEGLYRPLFKSRERNKHMILMLTANKNYCSAKPLLNESTAIIKCVHN
ncbi:hypothetical protein HELRODRAFT_162807 [Helobdella robusta]|uniref:Apple domain-containing protein n=1 Tax=Helobdella robusta TaxID=6412 RepID=T1ET69_HELRO|nr:hypothetical protein HELRODRAFT_162807 [Helobdella robusta]ESN99288.1 hypothetical protein HELRODRAFT_162807 [Helobdella robusta]